MQEPSDHHDIRRLIDALGGPVAAAATMVGKSGKSMDRRTMQRIYAGKLPASPTLRRQLADRVEATDGKA